LGLARAFMQAGLFVQVLSLQAREFNVYLRRVMKWRGGLWRPEAQQFLRSRPGLFVLSLTPLASGLLLQQAMISLLIGFNRINNEQKSRADLIPFFCNLSSVVCYQPSVFSLNSWAVTMRLSEG